MQYILIITGAIFAAWGAAVFIGAPTSIQEIAALIMWAIASILISAGAIIDAAKSRTGA